VLPLIAERDVTQARASRNAGPRVLFIIPGDDTSSASSMIFARRQADALARMGLDINIFYLRSRTSPAKVIAEFYRFRKALRTFRPEVVHAHFGTMTAFFAAAAVGTIPLVITYRGSDLNPVPSALGLRPRLGRLLSQIAALRANRIICVSRELRSRLWWSHRRATILASGVDPDIFRPIPRATARRAIAWPEHDRVVLFNAGHDPQNKRLDLALAAVRAARQELPDLRLEVLSGGVSPERIPLLMNASDCLLVTSDSEGSPTIVQEALATNLPIVSVAVGDIAERLAGVRYTRITDRDPAALGRALAGLAREPVRTDGRSRLWKLNSHCIARELCRLYRELGSRR
jgi:teichuronic acid biosynthesis glycosyltransferase TuaC